MLLSLINSSLPFHSLLVARLSRFQVPVPTSFTKQELPDLDLFTGSKFLFFSSFGLDPVGTAYNAKAPCECDIIHFTKYFLSNNYLKTLAFPSRLNVILQELRRLRTPRVGAGPAPPTLASPEPSRRTPWIQPGSHKVSSS